MKREMTGPDWWQQKTSEIAEWLCEQDSKRASRPLEHFGEQMAEPAGDMADEGNDDD